MAKLTFKIKIKYFLPIALIIVFAIVGSYLLLSSKATPTLSTDFNSDGVVNVFDLSILANNWNRTSATNDMGDANGDGQVNVFDLSVLASQWGQTSSGQPANSINVKDYGTRGDGVSDDTASLLTAFNAAVAQSKIAYIPNGTYKISSITIPNNAIIQGQDKIATWLKGHINFSSNQSYKTLKIGDYGVSAIQNVNGATNTTFDNIHFRGGGGPAFTYVVSLGSGKSASYITIKNSEVERNLGDQKWDSDSGYNNITIWVPNDAPVTDVILDNVHVGVSNGRTDIVRNTGSPRMGLEAYNNEGVTQSWKNIIVRNSVFEQTDGHSADFSDTPTGRGTGLLIENNIFKGGGLAGVWGWTLDLEMPLNPIVRNNTFYRGEGSWGYVVAVVDRDNPAYTSSGALITGNTFELDYDNSTSPMTGGWPFVLNGYDNQFTGNTVNCHYGTKDLFMLDHAYRSSITNNTLNIGSRPLFIEIRGSANNITSPNAIY